MRKPKKLIERERELLAKRMEIVIRLKQSKLRVKKKTSKQNSIKTFWRESKREWRN